MLKITGAKYSIEERRALASGAYLATWRQDFTEKDEALRQFGTLARGRADFDPNGRHRLVLLGPDRGRR